MNRLTTLLLCCFTTASILAQSGIIKGKVTNALNLEPIGYVPILVEGTTTGGTSDDNGEYTITGLEPGIQKGKEPGAWSKERRAGKLADLGFIILQSKSIDIVLSNLRN